MHNQSKAQSGWYSIPSGTSSWLRDIQVVNQNAVYAVGFGYTILKSTNLGSSWIIQYSGANFYNFLSVSFINEQTGYAAGGAQYDPYPPVHYGVVFKTTNGGNNWVQVHQGGSFANTVIYAIDSLKVIKASTLLMPEVFISTDGGYNWTSIQGIGGLSFYFVNELTGFALNSNQVSKTTDGGNNWINYSITTGIGTPRKIFFPNINTGYIVSVPKYVIKTTNSGQNWSSAITLANVSETFSIYCMNADTLYVTGRNNIANNGRIFRSTNGGQSWDLQFDGGSYTNPYSISFLNSQTGFTVGPTGLILKTTTGGEYISGNGNNNEHLPASYMLYQNYPNPFNPNTLLRFDLPKDGQINITLFDITGKKVQVIASEFKKAGSYKINFNGSTVSSGIYFYRFVTGEFTDTRKMILIK